MGTRRKVVGSIALLATAGFILGACSNAAPGTGGGGDEPDGESDGTLRLNFEDHPHFEHVVEEFKSQHPEITVEATTSKLTFEDGSVQSHLRSGEGADILLVNAGPSRINMLADGGLIVDISDVLNGIGVDERYSEGVIDQITYGDGEIYELPEGRDIFHMYYHADLFAEAGIAPPDTWDDLIASCQPLLDIGVQPIALGARNHFAGGWILGTLLQSSASEETMQGVLFGDDDFAQESIIAGAERLAELVDNGCINGQDALALDHHQAGAVFSERDAAMIVGTQSTIPSRQADGIDTEDIEMMPMPSNEPANEHPTSGLALSWIVNAESNATEEIEAWLDWISSEEYLEIAMQNDSPWAPARLVPDTSILDPAVADAVVSVEEGTGYNPSVYLPGDATQAWYDAVQGLLGGSGDPEALMQQVQAEIEASRDA